MKLTFIRLKYSFGATLLFAALFIVLYTGCKKDAVKPVTTTKTTAKPINYAALSKQIGMLLYKSITGQYGGASISTGFVSPYSMKGSNKVAYDITPMCGLVTDTNYNYTTHSNPGTIADVAQTYSGDLGFKYLCTGSNGTFPTTSVNGYIVNESTSYYEQGWSYTSTTGLQQSNTVVALDKTYKLVSMNGTVAAQAHYHDNTLALDSSLNATYALKGLTVDLTPGTADVTTGTATFYILDIPLYAQENVFFVPPPPETGTIEFLGNNEAKVTIDPGYVFLVNLLTGVVTPD